MANYSYCSDGTKLTDSAIKTRLSKAYKEYYLFEPMGACEGCGEPATCTAHILPKAFCKWEGRTELIFEPENWFRSCVSCNQKAENPSSEAIRELRNFDEILRVTEKYFPDRAEKMRG